LDLNQTTHNSHSHHKEAIKVLLTKGWYKTHPSTASDPQLNNNRRSRIWKSKIDFVWTRKIELGFARAERTEGGRKRGFFLSLE
jgi:hypothetical protein